MAFNELYTKYTQFITSNNIQRTSEIDSIGYSLLELAFTLDSKRIGSQQELEK